MNKQTKTTLSIFLVVIVVIILAILSVFFMIKKRMSRSIVVNVNGENIEEIDGEKIDIDVDRVFTIYTNEEKTEYNIFEIKDRKIKCLESTCDDQICVRFGAIDGSRDTDFIICAPHKIVVYFEK